MKSSRFLLPSDALLSPQLRCALPEGTPPAHSGLHTHLHGLHWAEGNVCKELGTSRGSQVETGAIEIGILLRLLGEGGHLSSLKIRKQCQGGWDKVRAHVVQLKFHRDSAQ